MKHEVIEIDGLFCVFINNRIASAWETADKAEEAVRRYRKEAREK